MIELHDFEPWAEALLPRVLPVGWKVVRDMPLSYGRDDGLLVLVSGRVEADGKRWLHVSCSRPNRLPNWRDLRDVKELFVGPSRLAVQVFPPKEQHVNIHPYVHHLWHCLDGDPVPDFRYKGQI
jgi:hypothetical protein